MFMSFCFSEEKGRLQQLHAAAHEGAESLAAQQAALQQGQVDELAHHGLRGGVGLHELVLLGAGVGHALLLTSSLKKWSFYNCLMNNIL